MTPGEGLRVCMAGVAFLAVVLSFGGVSARAGAPTTDLTKGAARRVAVTGDWLTVGGGGVWTSWGPALVRLDPRTGRRVTRVAVPEGPCEATVFASGYVWTATCQKPGLARVDVKTNRAAGWVSLAVPSSIGGEGSIGAGAGSIWIVTDGEACVACTLARVDAASLAVIATVPVDAGSAGVRFGLGAVWVTNPENSTVTKVDPSSNAVVAKTPVTGGPRFFAVGQGGVWTLNQTDGSVTRIDPATGAVRARIRARVVGEGGDMTTGAGWVWARGSGYLLSRIDPKTNRVVERYGPSLGSGAVIVGYGAVWISAHDDGSIFRLPLSKI